MRATARTLAAARLVFALAVSLAPCAASGGADETIGVSGHWVIEVRDPDGTPVMRQEFDNALVGGSTITDLVRGQRTPGPLRITFTCTGTCTPPCPASAVPGPCVIYEPREQFGPQGPGLILEYRVPSAFNNLVVSAGVNGLQLQGFAVVSADTTIAEFGTSLVTCPATIVSCVRLPSPSAAEVFPSRAPLTSTVLSPGVAVVAGQQVLVTVTITAATAPPAPAPQSGTAAR